MKIGLTYDLREDYLKKGFSLEEAAEFDKIETIESIESILQNLGFKTERIGHANNLMQQLLTGKRWDMVFNIAEGLYGFGRESIVPCLLDAYQIPYTFSDPTVLSLCLHKGLTKHVIQNLKIPTPDFEIVNNNEALLKVSLSDYPLFIKPISEGTGKGVSPKSIIHNKQDLKKQGEYLLKTFKQPILVETYLPGEEYTVGVLGSEKDAQILGIMQVKYSEFAYGEIYSFQNKNEYQGRMHYSLLGKSTLANEIQQLCLDAWRGLGCLDGGRIDVRLDKHNRPNFIEVNPLAGLHPIDSDLIVMARLQGLNQNYVITEIMKSALRRYGYFSLSEKL